MKPITSILKMNREDQFLYQRYMMAVIANVIIHFFTMCVMVAIGCPSIAMVVFVCELVDLVVIGVCRKYDRMQFLLMYLFVNMMIRVSTLTYFLGWEFGYGLYGVLLLPCCFIFSSYTKDRRIGTLKAFVLSTLDILLTLYVYNIPSSGRFSFSESQQKIVMMLNFSVVGIILVLVIMQFIRQINANHTALYQQARYDSMTGLRNRTGIMKDLQTNTNLYSIVMGDIDEFKMINDTYGHDVGDEVLSKIGRVLSTSVSSNDLVCRWGGEEFLLFIYANVDVAKKVMERICTNLSRLEIQANGETFHVTMTFGLAASDEAEDFDKLISLVDNRMYLGKRNGKNCIISAEHLIGGKLKEDAIKELKEAQIDKTGLSDRTFEAFAATLDNSYMYICNIDTNVSRWSKNAVEDFGLPSEYILDAGGVWLKYIHPDDRQKYIKDVNAVFSGQKEYHDVSYRALNAKVNTCCVYVVESF